MSINNLSFLQNSAVFLFFALCLSLPGGYSVGALVAVLAAVCGIPTWRKKTLDADAKLFLFFFLAVGVLWSHSFDGWWTWSSNNDAGLRYGLGALCLVASSAIFVNTNFLRWGLIVGALGAAVLAIFQHQTVGRAEGFTNAIRFGDIALSIAFACACFATLRNQSNWERSLLVLGAIAACLASLLSLSRGGWLVLVVFPMLWILFVEEMQTRIKLGGSLMVGVVLVCWVAFQVPAVERRVQTAFEQTQRYWEFGGEQAQTSVGARLEHWRLSWRLGQDKPLTGWGDKGVKEGKRAYVARGDAHPYMLEMGHSHNEFLEMWSRRGALGVLMLLGIYAVPAFIFYPTRRRLTKVALKDRQHYLALRIVGLSVPVCYVVYGLTETFFELSIGHMFYIFSMVFFFSAMKSLEMKVKNA
ncbi:O-antigen ligase family protein [Comamonas aquatica]|jgi:O-antigen ligase|nr:O-antigen ligase family protein [Comamonas aquatica]